jgi:hypothetical protein
MSFATGILAIAIVFTAVLAAVLNLLLLQRLLNEKKAAIDFMLEITIHLRASSQRNNQKFDQTITTIQGLHTVIDELHSNQRQPGGSGEAVEVSGKVVDKHNG